MHLVPELPQGAVLWNGLTLNETVGFRLPFSVLDGLNELVDSVNVFAVFESRCGVDELEDSVLVHRSGIDLTTLYITFLYFRDRWRQPEVPVDILLVELSEEIGWILLAGDVSDSSRESI